eukprot:1141281-Pelagomonas_calceolata.AAC.1
MKEGRVTSLYPPTRVELGKLEAQAQYPSQVPLLLGGPQGMERQRLHSCTYVGSLDEAKRFHKKEAISQNARLLGWN